MKNILFVINGLGGGGSQKNVTTLANHFANAGCFVCIAILLDGCTPFFELNKKIVIIDITRNNNSRSKNYLFWAKQIKTIEKKYQITHTIAIGYRFGLLCAFANYKKTKLIIRGTITKKIGLLEKIGFKLYEKRILMIVAQTSIQKKKYPSFLQKKIKIISNPFITFDVNKNTNGFLSKKIICIGRLHLPQKRQDILIESLSSFLLQHNYSLVLYGEPQIDDDGKTIPFLNKLIQKHNLENRVIIKKPIPNVWDDVLPCFAFVCASSREGMPNAMIEGMARGVIPITTNWEGANEIVENGYSGFVLPTFDLYPNISGILTKLENNKDIFLAMSENSRKEVAKKYNILSIVKQWDELIK